MSFIISNCVDGNNTNEQSLLNIKITQNGEARYIDTAESKGNSDITNCIFNAYRKVIK